MKNLNNIVITSLSLIIIVALFIDTIGCSSAPAPITAPASKPIQPTAPQPVAQIELNVSAAASLTDALKEINNLGNDSSTDWALTIIRF